MLYSALNAVQQQRSEFGINHQDLVCEQSQMSSRSESMDKTELDEWADFNAFVPEMTSNIDSHAGAYTGIGGINESSDTLDEPTAINDVHFQQNQFAMGLESEND